MPETPDFDAIAQLIHVELTGETLLLDEDVAPIREQLRLVWNARGAADIATLEIEIPKVWTAAEPTGPLTRALRKLDR